MTPLSVRSLHPQLWLVLPSLVLLCRGKTPTTQAQALRWGQLLQGPKSPAPESHQAGLASSMFIAHAGGAGRDLHWQPDRLRNGSECLQPSAVSAGMRLLRHDVRICGGLGRLTSSLLNYVTPSTTTGNQ